MRIAAFALASAMACAGAGDTLPAPNPPISIVELSTVDLEATEVAILIPPHGGFARFVTLRDGTVETDTSQGDLVVRSIADADLNCSRQRRGVEPWVAVPVRSTIGCRHVNDAGLVFLEWREEGQQFLATGWRDVGSDLEGWTLLPAQPSS